MSALLDLPWWMLTLSAIGAAAVVRWALWPVAFVILYGIGSTILNVLNTNWGKARARPLLFLRALVWVWPVRGMKDAIIWPASSVTAGPWRWVPLFQFKKIKI